jgi:hypothetical protein
MRTLRNKTGAMQARWWKHERCVLDFKLSTHTYLPMKMGQCSETSAYELQTPGNYPEESIQHERFALQEAKYVTVAM